MRGGRGRVEAILRAVAHSESMDIVRVVVYITGVDIVRGGDLR